ncbi:hypothetical protein BC831DRAFT_512877 [Entophlyctis helioformis]|nr:hypothetical protein BC831DRAFT_512877 [Entophlyctis helioformis]
MDAIGHGTLALTTTVLLVVVAPLYAVYAFPAESALVAAIVLCIVFGPDSRAPDLSAEAADRPAANDRSPPRRPPADATHDATHVPPVPPVQQPPGKAAVSVRVDARTHLDNSSLVGAPPAMAAASAAEAANKPATPPRSSAAPTPNPPRSERRGSSSRTP